jgi:hypothetical protein
MTILDLLGIAAADQPTHGQATTQLYDIFMLDTTVFLGTNTSLSPKTLESCSAPISGHCKF